MKKVANYHLRSITDKSMFAIVFAAIELFGAFNFDVCYLMAVCTFLVDSIAMKACWCRRRRCFLNALNRWNTTHWNAVENFRSDNCLLKPLKADDDKSIGYKTIHPLVHARCRLSHCLTTTFPKRNSIHSVFRVEWALNTVRVCSCDRMNLKLKSIWLCSIFQRSILNGNMHN